MLGLVAIIWCSYNQILITWQCTLHCKAIWNMEVYFCFEWQSTCAGKVQITHFVMKHHQYKAGTRKKRPASQVFFLTGFWLVLPWSVTAQQVMAKMCRFYCIYSTSIYNINSTLLAQRGMARLHILLTIASRSWHRLWDMARLCVLVLALDHHTPARHAGSPCSSWKLLHVYDTITKHWCARCRKAIWMFSSVLTDNLPVPAKFC